MSLIDVDVRLARKEHESHFAFRTDARITGVFGASGAGKTTMLHLIAGLLEPTTGRIAFDGAVLFDRSSRVDVPVHRRRIGMVFQDDRLFPHRSVQSNLRYGRRADCGGAISLDEVTDVLELEALFARRVGMLSGGERQRLAIGRAVLANPRLLLLDEPTSSLDRGHRARTLDLIARVHERFGTPMLYVSHDLSELLQLTDQVLLVDEGRIMGHGRLPELVHSPSAWRRVRALGAVNVLKAKVARHDPRAGLTRLALPARDAFIRGPLIDRAEGSTVRVSIRPEDIALASTKITAVSIRNQVPGEVTAVTAHPERSLVHVDVGCPLLVEVSHETVAEMSLAPGRAVHCLIKSNAVTYLGQD